MQNKKQSLDVPVVRRCELWKVRLPCRTGRLNRILKPFLTAFTLVNRYENGHAKKHFETNEQHSVCFDCANLVAYCYYCDEYVVNDTKTGLLEQLRTKMQALNE